MCRPGDRSADPRAADRPAETKLAVAFTLHHGRLTAYARRLLNRADAAEDVVQEVFLELWAKRSRLPTIESLPAYLYRAVRNRSLNERRRGEVEQRVGRHLAGAMAQLVVVPSEPVGLDGLHRRLRAAIAGLPPRTREVFLLSRDAGLTYAEIAERSASR